MKRTIRIQPHQASLRVLVAIAAAPAWKPPTARQITCRTLLGLAWDDDPDDPDGAGVEVLLDELLEKRLITFSASASAIESRRVQPAYKLTPLGIEIVRCLMYDPWIFPPISRPDRPSPIDLPRGRRRPRQPRIAATMRAEL